VVKLKRAEFEELWLTFKNFQVLKRYNNSNNYAMAVYHLAQEIKKRVEKKD
jgi:membrane-bound lytic murein transglycosylase B